MVSKHDILTIQLIYGLVIFALNILDSGVTSCNVIDQSMISISDMKKIWDGAKQNPRDFT
jgi:hypothetical protein